MATKKVKRAKAEEAAQENDAPPAAPVPEEAPPAPEEPEAPAAVEPEAPSEEEAPTPEAPVEDAPPSEEEAAPVPEEAPADVPVADPAPSEDVPVDVAGPNAEACKPSFLEVAEGELTTLVTTLEILVNKAKGESQGETAEVIRLGAAQLLKEAKKVISTYLPMLEEMRALEAKLSAEHQNLEVAKDYINRKSDDYRTERDAFVKLRALSDKEFFGLLEAVRKAQ